ncbi:MAG: hypothetical protein MUF73_05170 [Rhodobacteraceae bacterium]|nr:hypothetical protein [Paracoccaceae bacterium]
MFVVSPDTVWNPSALETRVVPRRFFGRATLWPRRGGGLRLWLRVIAEVEAVRYLATLSPFVVAALVWRDSAIAIAQAPLAMFLVIWVVEMRLLRRPPRAIDPAEADRTFDLLSHRATAILRDIAAGRDLRSGRLHLVVEQSELAHVPPLTLVSLQAEGHEGGRPAVLSLSADEVARVRSLFDATLTERRLHRANHAAGQMLRDVAFDAAAVSAHARLAARLARTPG